MPQPVASTIDMLLNVGVETLIDALLLAILIALPTAGAYLWLRRGKSDVAAILVAVILVANLACMVTGAGFIHSRSQSQRIGSLPGGQAISQSPRVLRPVIRGRQTASSRHASAKRIVNSVHTPDPPESHSQSE
jgi:hypothetical protein